ncbi:MAG: rRNA maturation RNase YbeY [Planktomarina sp.]
MFEDPRWELTDIATWADAAGSAVANHLSLPADAEAVILACDDARIMVLNTEFRDNPKATNVLSWPTEDLSADIAGDLPLSVEDPDLGNIAMAYETCVAEAGDQDKQLSDHVIHLLIHGILHLLGYDHIEDADADLMERTEVEILAKLHISNPYEDVT